MVAQKKDNQKEKRRFPFYKQYDFWQGPSSKWAAMACGPWTFSSGELAWIVEIGHVARWFWTLDDANGALYPPTPADARGSASGQRGCEHNHWLNQKKWKYINNDDDEDDDNNVSKKNDSFTRISQGTFGSFPVSTVFEK